MEKAEGGAEGRAFGEGERLLVHLTSADVSGLVDGVGGFSQGNWGKPRPFHRTPKVAQTQPSNVCLPCLFLLKQILF